MPYKYLLPLLLLFLNPSKVFSQMSRRLPASPVLYDPVPVRLKKDTITGLVRVVFSNHEVWEKKLEGYRLLHGEQKQTPCNVLGAMVVWEGLKQLSLAHPSRSDLRYALEEFQRAEAYDCCEAFPYLFYMYHEGRGIKRDTLKAAKYLKKARAADVSGAVWFDIAYFYETGESGIADTAAALTYYRIAAQKGYPAAEFMMGLYYLNGYTVQHDGDVALQWLERAAARGIDQAYYEIANIYLNADGVPRDYSRAFENFIMAADMGNDQAMYLMGWLYEHGKGVERSDTTAAVWYKQAAYYNNPFAHGSLGVLLYEGRGVEKDTASGYRMIREAAEAGVPFYQTYQRIIEGRK